PSVSLFVLPTCAQELFSAGAVLVRDPARAGAPSLGSRVAAYAGTFMLVLFFNGVRTWYPAALIQNPVLQVKATGVLLWLIGSLLALAGVWSLRRSFSIEPQARQLVISGPYRYARHPIYACYFLQYFGLLLVYPTLALLTVLVTWTLVMIIRMHYEERVLATAFPEYALYKTRVGRLAPKLRRAWAPASAEPDPMGNPLVANHG
ncbi:MAG: methyltransferase family protein, partial [Acidobacteriota bacterium]